MPSCSLCHDLDGTSLTPACAEQAWHASPSGDGVIDKHNFHFRVTLETLFMMKMLGCPNCGMFFDAIMKFQSELSEIEEGKLNIFVEYHIKNGMVIQSIEGSQGDEHGMVKTGLGLELYTVDDKASIWQAMRTLRDVRPDPLSARPLAMMKGWIDDCIKNHENCKLDRTVKLPKRVLDVSDMSILAEVKLYETQGEEERYCALSHCWGKTQIITTTKVTLEKRKTLIEWEDLSTTFKCAIKATRALGIKYLWIDSLCIIQDDEIDWQTEAAQMGNIYEGAYITLAASQAADGSRGFLNHRQRNAEISTMLPPFKVHVRPLIPHFASGIQDAGVGTSPHPLMTRAWCFQERLLSCRTLHFTASEVMFECRSESHCECNDPSAARDQPFKTLFQRVLQYSPDSTSDDDSIPKELGVFWGSMLFAFHMTQITYPKDILPALSAIASRMPRDVMGNYHAGLWEKLFPAELCWHSPTLSCSRPKPATAPTFSWASRIGPLMIPTGDDDNFISYVKLHEIICRPKGADAFGEIESGWVSLFGQRARANFTEIVPDHKGFGNCRLVRKGKADQFFCADSKEDALEYQGKVSCLRILHYKSMAVDVALVLRSEGVSNFCWRIGLAYLDPSWFEGVQESVVSIF